MKSIDYSAIGRLQDGDLVLFIQGGFWPTIIELYTKGPYSHVGIIRFRNGHPYVIEAKYATGVVETPLQDYLEDGNITLVFVRILNGNAMLSKADGQAFAQAAYEAVGEGYDIQGIIGFIWLVTHHIFKFLPITNPFDDAGKFWCAEIVREKFRETLVWDFLDGVREGFESPNDIVRKRPDGTARVTVI